MPMQNSDIARIFEKVADLLSIKGENPFRIRAYQNAARTVASLSAPVSEMVARGEDLSKLPGIGKDLAGKIKAIVKTGSLEMLEDLQRELPDELAELMRIGGLGPRRVGQLYKELGIRGLEDLRKAVEEKKIRGLAGFGAKTEAAIREELGRLARQQGRYRISEVEPRAEALLAWLRGGKGAIDVVAAGSYRRRKETVKDLDILATCEDGSDIMGRLEDYEDVDAKLSHGETRSSVVLSGGLHVDLRVVPEESYGAALVYFTGSKEHSVATRKLAVSAGLKWNEYGVFRGKRRIAGETEQEVYKTVGLAWIPPELRENRGEVEAAREGRLPTLVEMKDIRGDLHVHSDYTDGRNSIEEMAKAAGAMGYKYIAVTDHTRHLTVAGGLDAERLRKQMREIDALNEKLAPFVILKGSEVDILEDGSLDLPDEVLAELDVVVCAVHSKFNLPREQQTRRIVRAMENPYFGILAHPTGRLINSREPYDLDMEKVMRAAKDNNVVLDASANPERLDLDDIHCKMAKDAQVKVAISTDAHRTGDLEFMHFGIGQGRRGWLEAGDVVNTRTAAQLKRLLRRGRRRAAHSY